MTGSLLELVAIGSEDQYFIGNPKRSFFKNVFHKHNNFAIERIFTYNKATSYINKFSPKIFNFYIDPLKGDLLDKIFLRISLPKIYNTSSERFKWVKNLGSVIIDELKLIINDKVIEKIDTNMIFIENTIHLKTKQKKIFDELTGNIPEYNNPYENPFTSHYYKLSLQQPVDSTNTLQSLNKTFNNIPNILGRYIYIPLPVYFNRNVNSYLPLCKLLKSKIQVQVTLKPFSQLYILLENRELYIRGKKYKYEHQNLDKKISITKDLLEFDPVLISYTLFLQDSVKTSLFNTQLSQLITINTKTSLLVNNKNNFNIQIKDVKKGNIKELYILSQRDDIDQRNDWLNYTIYDDLSYIDKNFNEFYTYYFELASKQYKKDLVYKETLENVYIDIFAKFKTFNMANIKIMYTQNNTYQEINYYNINPNNIQDKNIREILDFNTPFILNSHSFLYYYLYFIKPEIIRDISININQFVYRYYNTNYAKKLDINNMIYLPSIQIFGNLLILNFNKPQNSQSVLTNDLTIRYDNLLEDNDLLNLVSFWEYRNIKTFPVISRNNINYFNSLNIIENYGIILDGNELNTEIGYPFNHYGSLIEDIRVSNVPGIIYYPFTLYRDIYQPSGHLNIDRIKKIECKITLKDYNIDKHPYKFNTFVYINKYYTIIFDNDSVYLID
tara:strand:- start:14319 stop:16328 length:2010 start_codon:yes stop_codon:yes gene_type:complete